MTRYQQSKCQACGWLGLSVAEVMEDNRLCASCSWQVLRPLPISQGDRRLGTTFPRLPCQLAFSQLLPRRLGGRRRREAIVLLVQAGQCGLQKCWLWFQQQEQGDPSNRIVGVCSVALGHSLLLLQSSKLVLSFSLSLPPFLPTSLSFLYIKFIEAYFTYNTLHLFNMCGELRWMCIKFPYFQIPRAISTFPDWSH